MSPPWVPPPRLAPAAAAPEGGLEAALPEDRREEVRDGAEGVHVGRVAAAAQALLAVGVVELAPLGIGEHLVGAGGLLELLLRLRVVGVDVRVQLARELAERLLDLRVVGAPVDAERVVVVAGHQSP